MSRAASIDVASLITPPAPRRPAAPTVNAAESFRAELYSARRAGQRKAARRAAAKPRPEARSQADESRQAESPANSDPSGVAAQQRTDGCGNADSPGNPSPHRDANEQTGPIEQIARATTDPAAETVDADGLHADTQSQLYGVVPDADSAAPAPDGSTQSRPDGADPQSDAPDNSAATSFASASIRSTGSLLDQLPSASPAHMPELGGVLPDPDAALFADGFNAEKDAQSQAGHDRAPHAAVTHEPGSLSILPPLSSRWSGSFSAAQAAPTGGSEQLPALAAAAASGDDAPVQLDHLVETLAGRITDRDWRVSLRLDPPELGRLRLDVSMEGDSINLRVQVASEDVRRLVESRLSQLHDALGKHDLQVARTDIIVQRPESGEEAGRQQGQLPRQFNNERPFEESREQRAPPRDAQAHGGPTPAIDPAASMSVVARPWPRSVQSQMVNLVA